MWVLSPTRKSVGGAICPGSCFWLQAEISDPMVPQMHFFRQASRLRLVWSDHPGGEGGMLKKKAALENRERLCSLYTGPILLQVETDRNTMVLAKAIGTLGDIGIVKRILAHDRQTGAD